jgi:hypothetical protein
MDACMYPYYIYKRIGNPPSRPPAHDFASTDNQQDVTRADPARRRLQGHRRHGHRRQGIIGESCVASMQVNS